MIPRLLSAVAFVAFSFGGLVSAQNTDELASDYVNMPEVQAMMADMFSPDAMLAQFRAGLPPNVQLTVDQESQIGALLSAAMLKMKPDMENLMISGAAKHFSADELRALIEFYQSEHGASVMAKMQPFFQDVMVQMGPAMQTVMQDVTPQIIEIVQGG